MYFFSTIMGFIFWLGYFLVSSNEKWNLKERSEKYKQHVQLFVERGRLFRGFKKFSQKRKNEVHQRELSDCLAYIKNIVILGRGETMSAELLLEELSDMSDSLAPIFLAMAHCMHICENQRAEQLFCDALAGDFSKDIAKLFVEWESIPSEKLLGTVIAYRSVLLEKRLSKQKKKDELVSDIIYFPVVVNSMAVLLNFIYVAYFIEQREALMSLF